MSTTLGWRYGNIQFSAALNQHFISTDVEENYPILQIALKTFLSEKYIYEEKNIWLCCFVYDTRIKSIR